jgi:hypothetical protein
VVWDRFEIVYTPKHGRQLNMAAIEVNFTASPCLGWRMDNIETIRNEVAAWQARCNNLHARVNWQFTTKDACGKPNRLYPTTFP